MTFSSYIILFCTNMLAPHLSQKVASEHFQGGGHHPDIVLDHFSRIFQALQNTCTAMWSFTPPLPERA